MSVINRVLKDLDRQGHAPAQAVPGIRIPATEDGATHPAGRMTTRLALLLAASLLLALLLWQHWPQRPIEPPAPPRPPVPLAAARPPAPPPALPAQPPSPALPPPTPSTRPTSAPNAAPPPPPPRQAAAHFSVAARLDRRLPELSPTRSSAAPPAAGKTQISKEVRPLSTADQAEDLWRQGRRLHEQGQIHEARSRYEQALLADAQHLRARQSLAVACLESGQRGKAEEVLREGVARHPGESWFLRSLAQMQIQQGDYPQAAEVLKTGLAHGRGEAADWALYASTLGKLGHSEASREAYREALRRDPGQGAWWIGLGVALEHSGHRPEAAEAYTRALQTRLNAELKEFATQKVQEIGKGG